MGSESWTECTVDSIKSEEPNALSTGPFGSAISSRFFISSGVPVIRGSNLSQDVGVRLNDEGLAFIDVKKAQEFNRSVARRGDLVFTCWGTIDQVGLIDDRSQFAEYVVSNKQMKLTPDPTKVDSLFLYYLMSSPAVRDQILNIGIGSSVPGFNLGQLRSLRLVLPPLAEQRSIARILGALDDKINLNREMNENLEAIAQGLFKSWFVNFDPVRLKAAGQVDGADPSLVSLFPDELEESAQGFIPRGWRLVGLTEALDINPRYSLAKATDAPYLDMASTPTAGHRPHHIARRVLGSGVKFKNGDTLLARITPCLENGKTAFVDFLGSDEVGWGSTEFIVMRPKPPLPPFYGYLLARHPHFRSFAIRAMTGSSGRQRVDLRSLGEYQVVLPDAAISRAFGEIIEPLRARMSVASEQNGTLSELRDELLPRLVSGQLRIPEAQEAIEEALH